MNPIDFQTVHVRLLYWPLLGQAVMAVDLQLQWKAILGALFRAALRVLQLGIHPSSPSFIPCSLSSYEAGVYLDSSAVELLVVNVNRAVYMPCVISPVNT